MSHSLKPREFGLGNRGTFGPGGAGAIFGASAFDDEDSDPTDDLFRAINRQGMN